MYRPSLSLSAVAVACALVSLFVPEAHAEDNGPGAVYTLTNATTGNAVLAWHRDGNGALTPLGPFFTGGLGTGGKEPDFALANASALILSEDGHWLFTVNPGSDDISVFSAGEKGLSLVDRVPSGGHLPISVAVSGNLLYVLNAGGNDGGTDNISGFSISSRGRLTAIPNSTRALSGAATNPAEVRFNREGSVVVVTERIANNIDTFFVNHEGLLTGPVVNAEPVLNPAGPTNPFGFDFDARGGLFVSDDFNDQPGLAAASSFRIGAKGVLIPVSANVGSGEAGACWVAVSRDSRYVYVVNAVSSAISTYAIDPSTEKITLVSTVASPTNPTDLGFSLDGKFLYALAPDETGSTPGLLVYKVDQKTGALTALPGLTGLPDTIDGLAVR